MSIMLSRETIKIMMKVQRLVKDEFGVRIDEDDFGELTTLAKITAYIEEKKG